MSLWIIYKCYHRIEISESIDVHKTSASKECIICHYWYFLDKAFRFQLAVCNGCHDILFTSIDINNITVLNIYGLYYRCIINGINKSEAMSLLQNAEKIK